MIYFMNTQYQSDIEKVLHHGPEYLSDAELISTIMGNSISCPDTLKLANKILIHAGGLHALSNLMQNSPGSLMTSFPEIGTARCSKLSASMYISRRIAEKMNFSVSIENPETLAASMWKAAQPSDSERMVASFIDSTAKLILLTQISQGSPDSVPGCMRRIMSLCLSVPARGIVIAHTHPGGELKPSRDDLKFTEICFKALDSIGVVLLDHLILNEYGYISVKDSKIKGHWNLARNRSRSFYRAEAPNL